MLCKIIEPTPEKRGGVSVAQPLMVIVPKENVLEVEAILLNKDFGFVNPGRTPR